MIELRPYQRDAVQAVYRFFKESRTGCPIISAAPGTGKSVIIGTIASDIVKKTTTSRVLITAHVKELIEQNANKAKLLCPEVPVGIFSAGLNEKNLNERITVAGIQSLARNLKKIGRYSVMLVDECHLLSSYKTSQYQKVIAVLKQNNPNIRIVGFSATPWRTKDGLLIEGDDALFTDIVFNYTIKNAISDGYLSRLSNKNAIKSVDTSKLHTKMGEYVSSESELLFNQENITEAAIDEILTYAQNRKTWLIFCAGVDHARQFCHALNRRGIKACYITSETKPENRDYTIESLRNGGLQAVTNNAVLTTGTDIPNIDLIVLLRPTRSPGLFIQMIGRGTRLHPGKEDCLVLDFAGNFERFGPIDLIEAPSKKEKKPGEGGGAIKTCPECREAIPIALRECYCGYIFPEPEKVIHATKASAAAIFSDEEEWLEVFGVAYKRHTKPFGIDSLCVIYLCTGNRIFKEWICLEHEGYARNKATDWVRKRIIMVNHSVKYDSLLELVEEFTIDDAVNNPDCLTTPLEICIKKDGKYWRIIDYMF